MCLHERTAYSEQLELGSASAGAGEKSETFFNHRFFFWTNLIDWQEIFEQLLHFIRELIYNKCVFFFLANVM